MNRAERAVSSTCLSVELDGNGQLLEGSFSDKEGRSWGLVRCISMLSGLADDIKPYSKKMLVGYQARRTSVTYTDVVRCRSPRLKDPMLMGTCHWCRLETYQGILTRLIPPPSSATCQVCYTSSAAVTRWNTWSTTHSWPRKSLIITSNFTLVWKCSLVSVERLVFTFKWVTRIIKQM